MQAVIYMNQSINQSSNHHRIASHRVSSATHESTIKKKRKGGISNPLSTLLQKHSPGGCSGTESLVAAEDRLTTEPRLAYHSTELLALVRRALIAEEHSRRLDGPLGGVIEDADIRVEADDQITLLFLQTDLGGGVGAAEADDVLEGVLGVDVLGRRGETLPTAELGPENGQSETDGGDATPGGEEAAAVFVRGRAVLLGGTVGVSVGSGSVGLVVGAAAWDVRGQELQVRSAGGVIRDHGLDNSVLGVALEFGP